MVLGDRAEGSDDHMTTETQAKTLVMPSHQRTNNNYTILEHWPPHPLIESFTGVSAKHHWLEQK